MGVFEIRYADGQSGSHPQIQSRAEMESQRIGFVGNGVVIVLGGRHFAIRKHLFVRDLHAAR